MKSLEIIGYKRANLGKKSSKDLRLEAYAPCVLYGGEKQVHFYSPMILFRDLLYTPDAYLVKLNIEGELFECILQEAQFHPVNEMILHVDFLEIKQDKPIKVEIPVAYEGNAPGVIIGGKLVPKLTKLKVKALAKDIPEKIAVDISGLELGKTIKVKDLKVEGYEILNSASTPIVSIEIPRALKGQQAEASK